MSPPHIYQNLANFTEYRNFQYKFDFGTVISLISFIFYFPTFFCTLKMIIFYFQNPKITVALHSIHPYVFKSFLVMQFWNTVNTILEFFTFRIPSTTLFTSICVALPADSFYRFFMTAVYFSLNNAQFFTVLFCLMRTLILYTLFNQDKLCKRLFVVWSIVAYLLSTADSVPTIFGTLLCIQLDTPYQDGAIFITTSSVFRNYFMNTLHVIFATIILLAIVASTGLVIIKLRSESVKKAASQSFQRAKAETTLTITTFLICIPLFLVLGLMISSLAKFPYYSYILALRPLMLDLRVNTVSIYFYLTHPMFKKKQKIAPAPTMFVSSTV